MRSIAIDLRSIATPHWELSFNAHSRAIENDERRCGSVLKRNVLRSIALTESDFPETQQRTKIAKQTLN